MNHSSAAWVLLLQTFVVTVPAVYLIRAFGLSMGWVDKPNERKVHQTPIVTIGGLGIFIGLFASFCLFHLWRDLGRNIDEQGGLVRYKENAHLWLLFGSSLILVLVGVWDDLRDCNPFVKLAFQILAALVFVGFRVTSGKTWWFEPVSPLAVIREVVVLTGWIVLLLNAINLIDGLDGLAAGTVAIAAFWLLLANGVMENQFLTWVSAMLVGGCLAFLVFNFNPATIFMGDTGALLLGLWLGAGSGEGEFLKLSGLILATPIVLLIVPLLEVFSSTLRRLFGGQGVFKADSKHMHHRLLKLGFRHRNIVLFYYGITTLLGMLGFLLAPGGFTKTVPPQPIPRISDPTMMFGILVVIVGGVFLAFLALSAIERRFERAIQEIKERYEGGQDIQRELTELVEEKETGPAR
jgi:UDP-GlcNAc:undecaprenyl-phosphate GlcNAc-1-phosphate transferase